MGNNIWEHRVQIGGWNGLNCRRLATCWPWEHTSKQVNRVPDLNFSFPVRILFTGASWLQCVGHASHTCFDKVLRGFTRCSGSAISKSGTSLLLILCAAVAITSYTSHLLHNIFHYQHWSAHALLHVRASLKNSWVFQAASPYAIASLCNDYG